MAFVEAIDPVTMMEPPSRIIGSAFCTLNSNPRVLTPNA